VPLRWSCPDRYRKVFDPSNRVFRPFLGDCHSLRFLGREKGVCDKLRRHPLIDPIFRLHPAHSPRRSVEALSISLARQNLYLVIPPKAGPSRFISIIQLLTAAILHGQCCFVKRKIHATILERIGGVIHCKLFRNTSSFFPVKSAQIVIEKGFDIGYDRSILLPEASCKRNIPFENTLKLPTTASPHI
jgi:hypothetical protein